jgi:hypothetical protein
MDVKEKEAPRLMRTTDKAEGSVRRMRKNDVND